MSSISSTEKSVTDTELADAVNVKQDSISVRTISILISLLGICRSFLINITSTPLFIIMNLTQIAKSFKEKLQK